MRVIIAIIEILILSALILATRCANYQDVFVAGNIYFVDADCYARMTRVQICDAQPGLIVRHHVFENFPQGTTPHTTAPLRLSHPRTVASAKAVHGARARFGRGICFAVACAAWRLVSLVVVTRNAIPLSLGNADSVCDQSHSRSRDGAWQARSSILIHPARDDRDLRGVAFAEPASSRHTGVLYVNHVWHRKPTHGALVAGLGRWRSGYSAYEPLVLFLHRDGHDVSGESTGAFCTRSRRAGWLLFAAIIVAALLIERRIPSIAIFQSDPIFKNWSRTIGELVHVSPTNPVWLRWCGYLLLVAPFLIWMSVRRQRDSAHPFDSAQSRLGRALPVYGLLIATYFLTIWQARWGYFFVLIFVLALPALLAPIKSPAAVWIAFVLSIFPILRDWDERLWPNETQLAARVERRNESAQLRELALSLQSSEVHPFLAPWWLSPSIAYWSGQPGVAGSSHESLNGIADSARFFLSDDLQKAREILQNHRVAWVCAYDADRVAQNSAAVLSQALPPPPLCRVLDRTPGQAPRFLIFSAQSAAFKLYRVADER